MQHSPNTTGSGDDEDIYVPFEYMDIEDEMAPVDDREEEEILSVPATRLPFVPLVPFQESDDEEDEEEMASDDPLEEWKDALRADFEGWLESLTEIPDATTVDTTPDDAEDDGIPDLASFHAELAALSAESRKANRRTAEAFSQWGDVLKGFQDDLTRLRDRIPAAAPVTGVTRSFAAALVEMNDRLHRLAEAARQTPRGKVGLFGSDAPWREAWQAQCQALEITRSHFASLLEKQGLRRIAAAGEIFDPSTMIGVEAVTGSGRPPHTVLSELAPGWMLSDDVIRPAQVRVAAAIP